MVALVLDDVDLHVKDLLEFEEYDFIEDIDYGQKSSIKVVKKPNIENHDFVICRGVDSDIFIGICDTFDSGTEQAGYKISLLQKECFFDRTLWPDNEDIISSTGIEDFIARTITDNWIDSGDALMDKSYISVNVQTHTPITVSIDTVSTVDNGVYNFKTFLGNAKEKYGIYTDFVFTNTTLTINIYKNDDVVIPIDITVSDISNYDETYEVDAMAKLYVRWVVPYYTEDNVQMLDHWTDLVYYLKADRTITTDGTDPDRANGTVKSTVIQTESSDEMYERVIQEFQSNQYNHRVVFDLKKDSQIYPFDSLYVGRKCTMKTKTGIKTTLVTAKEYKDDSKFCRITFGKLKVSLIEKLRRS